MKKIERLELKLVWELSEEKYRYSVYDKLNELTDAVNLLLKRDEENCLEKAKAELLETHTVKEERFIGKGQYEKDMPKYEEQEKENKEDNDFIESIKLPTSSYEVTCGRCEKSISHKCGRV